MERDDCQYGEPNQHTHIPTIHHYPSMIDAGTAIHRNTDTSDESVSSIDTNNYNIPVQKPIFLFNPFINHRNIISSQKVTPMLKKYFTTQNSTLSHHTLNSSLRIASHNVNGINSPIKQLSLLQSIRHKYIDIMGICNTRLNQKNANFACQSDKNYRTHWTPKSPNNMSGGLGTENYSLERSYLSARFIHVWS